MKTITKKQWNKIHSDYKCVIDGVNYCYLGCIENNGGTQLVPINII